MDKDISGDSVAITLQQESVFDYIVRCIGSSRMEMEMVVAT